MKSVKNSVGAVAPMFSLEEFVSYMFRVNVRLRVKWHVDEKIGDLVLSYITNDLRENEA